MNVHFPLLSIQVETEEIPVESWTPQRNPDESWRYVDSQGHIHTWISDTLPSLERVQTGMTWGGDEYEHYEVPIYEWWCRHCHERVEPGYKLDYSAQYVQGPTWVTITINDDNFRLSQEQYAEAIDRFHEQLRQLNG